MAQALLIAWVTMSITKYFSIILAIIFIVPTNLYAGGIKNIVVVPILDGKGDDAAKSIADDLRASLSSNSRLDIVEKKKVDSVLKYYDNDTTSEISHIANLITRAKESYYRLNYIEGKSIIKKAIADLKKNKNTLFDHGSYLLDAYLTLGIISKSMGNVGEARQAFREALRLDPNYKLDSRAFSPSLVNLFENVRNSLNILPVGDIRVESNPKVAEVYLNGIFRGVAPITIKDVPEGKNYIKLSANKYQSVRKEVNVAGGKTAKVKEKLAWTAGKKGTLDGKNYVSASTPVSQVDEGLRIARLLKADKVVMVDAAGGGKSIQARMVDAEYKTGHKLITVSNKDGNGVSSLAGKISSQSFVNIASNPTRHSEPLGMGDTVLLGSKKRSKISKPVLYGIIGGVVAAGLGAGLAAAFAGGGGGGGGTGSVNVNFSNR